MPTLIPFPSIAADVDLCVMRSARIARRVEREPDAYRRGELLWAGHYPLTACRCELERDGWLDAAIDYEASMAVFDDEGEVA